MSRLLEPLARRIRNLVSRAVVRLVDDTAQLQALQIEVLEGEVLDQVEHWQPYGLTAHPQTDAEALILSAGGSRARAVVVAVSDRRYRLTGLAAGEVALHDDQGQSVQLTRSGIVVTGTAVQITAPQVTITGACTVTGLLTAQGGITMSGGSAGAAAAITGDLSVTGDVTAGTVTAGEIGLSTHHHTGTDGPLP